MRMGPNVTWSRAPSGITLKRKMPPSRKVLQAILFTSLLWLCIDIVLLTTYSIGSESSGQNSMKLPSRVTNKRSRSNHERMVPLIKGNNNLGINIWNKMLGRLQEPKKTKVSAAKPQPKQLGDSASSDSQRDHSGRTKPIKRPFLKQMKGNNDDDKVLQHRNVQHDPEGQMEIARQNLRNQDKSYHKAKFRNETKKRSDTLENMTFHYVKNLDASTNPRNPGAPGEGGRAVRTKVGDKSAVELGWKHASFNEFVSDMISVERSIRDTRPYQCQRKMYADRLPTTTVIICFTEESWSTLLRTVHSVLNRSPPELIEEILLIDDFSQREYLKDGLDRYMSRLPKVRIIRLQRREGLIRARIRGADQARGQVLTFLDSHVECNVGWLEPLLQRIWDDRRNVVCPTIDGIDADSFSYDGAARDIVGSFTWDLQFRWQGLPAAERERRAGDDSKPMRTPAMAGGLFSIDKDYFYELGTYDPGFDIWGAENLELSFKVWMCGGQLEILPCSKVGHVFRKTQPYKFPEGNVKTFLRNTQRMVEVWLDPEYKQIFYKMRPELLGKPFGNIEERILLKQKLGCHNFKWYLENVFPSLQVPDTKFRASGEVRNEKLRGKCMDSMGGGLVAMYPCHGKGFNQQFALTWTSVVQFELMKCLTSLGAGIRVSSCNHGSLQFRHTKNDVMHERNSGKCLDVNERTNQLVLNQCDGTSKQRWKWAKYFNRNGLEI
ncbi:polypeptide N-acetylgalactosaminyltransferase 13-like [Amphiura filiformis]|uniref:polypeptide N-acetylgalactosaminyltransferase 13-like n=1 Tax=Amphiura filiformis TaxID=82378 RepID=UPI003B216F2C